MSVSSASHSVLQKNFKPTNIKNIFKLSTKKDPQYHPIIMTTSHNLIKNNGYQIDDTKAMQDITKDIRYHHLKDRVQNKWDNLQKTKNSQQKNEREIATFAVQNIHTLFGDYDRLMPRLKHKISAAIKLSDSEQEYYDQNKKRDMPLSEYPHGSFTSTEFNHILAHILKNVANIDSTIISTPTTHIQNNTYYQGRLGMVYLNDQDIGIKGRDRNKPIKFLQKDTCNNLLSGKTDIINTLQDGKPHHKYHIYPMLNMQEVALSKMAQQMKKDKQKITAEMKKSPLNMIRNKILNHILHPRTLYYSPNDIKYLKFMFEREQDLFKKIASTKA